MAKLIKDKLRELKSVLNGTMDFSQLKPPAVHSVFEHLDPKTGEPMYYENGNVRLTVDEYNAWVETLRNIDHVIIWREQKGNAPLIDTDDLPQVTAQPVDEPKPEKQVKPRKKKELKEQSVIEPDEEPRMVTLKEHQEFNRSIFNKLF